MHRLAALLTFVLAFAGLAASAAAGDDEPKVRVARAEFLPPQAAAGTTATVEIELAIDVGWHVYAQRHEDYRPPTFEWKLPAGWTKKGALAEVGEPHEIDFFGDKLYVFDTKAVYRQAFDIAKDAAPGRTELTGTGAWQRCDDASCADENDVPVAASLEVLAAGTAVSGAKPPDPPVPAPVAAADPTAGSEDDGESQSMWGVVLSGMGWGLLTVLTPCVFPLLPVTVSFFSKQAGPPLPRSLVYAFGIVFTVTVIGLVFKSGLDVMARGSLFNLLVGLLFIVLALSLFGLFELRLPSFLIDKSQEKSAGGGLAGAFFMAVTLALTSFSCSVPFLAIMFARFEQGNVAQSIVGLLAYGVTLAFPFFVCSLFPSLLKSLPRSGGWLNAVKVTMGFVELGLAFKFLRTVALNEGSDALSRPLVLAIWTACALGAALYLFGYVTLPHDTKVESIGVVRLVFALTFLTMAVWFGQAMFNRPLFPALDGFIQTEAKDLEVASAGSTTVHAEEAWPRNDWDGALARAAEKKRPALFDFTGVG